MKNTTANIIFNDERLKAFPLRSGVEKTRMFHLHNFIQHWKFQPEQLHKKEK